MSESLREIVFDTETTGKYPAEGDRIVEIGCVEMLNHTPTGKTFHCYINPEREVPDEVVKIHGLTTEFLSDKPVFAEIVQDFLDFIGEDSKLVAHNADFDMEFINMELKRINLPELSMDRKIDTLAISRKKLSHLGNHTLDRLCNYYNIDKSQRNLHGALLDARLLAEVYIELLGGKEVDFFKVSDAEMEITSSQNKLKKKAFRPSRNFPIPEADLQNHNEFISSLGETLWNKKEESTPAL